VKALDFAHTIVKLAMESQKPDARRERGYMERDRKNIIQRMVKDTNNMTPVADKLVFRMFLERFGTLPAAQRPAWFETALKGKYTRESIDTFLGQLPGATRIYSTPAREAMLKSSVARLKQSPDLFIRIAFGLYEAREAAHKRRKINAGALFRLLPHYLESLIAQRGSLFYPDANASPRISFAHVWGYAPRDGLWATPFTTLTGLLAKNREKDPFLVPQKVLAFGKATKNNPYVDAALGDIPMCFLSGADTTGGNSGSPVLNSRGEFIGLNFDRVYENIVGDFGYGPARSRNIMVHVNAILWWLDNIMGATRLLSDMGVKPATTKP
ncbi:S46 family peptidase, partial [Myxococcota bacterium]|nr:S46 family peptidase [Myxococcota bacterium]MBU1535299.1 S46 family peptidase [Myxococcota bacterium]